MMWLKIILQFDVHTGLDPKQVFSYFFTKTDKKHQNGKRLNRFTKDQKGHWRITSKIQEVTEEDGKTVIGRKNVLVYMYENKVKTNWIMHEYMLDHNYANKNNEVSYLIFIFFTGSPLTHKRSQFKNPS